MKSSFIEVSLQSSEQIFYRVYHNYTTTGNYSVIMSVYTNEHLETEEIDIGV